MGIKDKEIIQRFLEKPINRYDFDWNVAMALRDKISAICGYDCFTINRRIQCSWWYSTKPYVFEWREKRQPFSGIGGTFYSLTSDYSSKSTNNLECMFKVAIAWIKWYNKTIKTNEKIKTKSKPNNLSSRR